MRAILLTVHLVPLYLNPLSMANASPHCWVSEETKEVREARHWPPSLTWKPPLWPLVSGTLIFSDKCQDARAVEHSLPEAVVLRRRSGKDLVLAPSTFPVLALISCWASFSSLPEDSTSTWQPLHKFFFILKWPAPRSPPGARGKRIPVAVFPPVGSETTITAPLSQAEPEQSTQRAQHGLHPADTQCPLVVSTTHTLASGELQGKPKLCFLKPDVSLCPSTLPQGTPWQFSAQNPALQLRGGPGPIPGWGTKIPQAMRCSRNNTTSSEATPEPRRAVPSCQVMLEVMVVITTIMTAADMACCVLTARPCSRSFTNRSHLTLTARRKERSFPRFADVNIK